MHSDKFYSPYTFTLNVNRRINPEQLPTSVPQPTYKTRAAVKQPEPSDHSPVWDPIDGGSSFVDVTLGIVVRQAQGTMMAIRAEHQHGTSK